MPAYTVLYLWVYYVIGNYLIVEVGIKKLLGEMMRIAH